MTDDLHEIIVCQGPPECELQGNAVLAAQQNDCPWCKRILIDEDGNEQITEPGHA